MERYEAYLCIFGLGGAGVQPVGFAADPEPLPVPLPGVTDPEQPEKPDGPEVQPYEAMPGIGDMD